MNIQIGIAGLPDELELRLSLACGLLAASQLEVEIQPWKGRPCDVLVIDLDNGYGRLAQEIAARRKVPVLAFGQHDPAAAISNLRLLDRQAPAAVIAKALQEILQPSSALSTDNLEGLLGICLREIGCDDELLARHGGISVVVRHTAGRILARSMSDLHAAEARLLDSSWLSGLKPTLDPHESEWLVSRSLESFLVTACRRHQASLPLLGEASYRLSRWPDLGAASDDAAALNIAALLYRSPWSIQALAEHIQLDARQVNAFCWATLASGVLSNVDSRIRPAAVPALAHATLPSMLQRVARHFGLKIGYSHA